MQSSRDSTWHDNNSIQRDNTSTRCETDVPESLRRRKRSVYTHDSCTRRSKRSQQLGPQYIALHSECTLTNASTLPLAKDCAKCGAIKFAFESCRFCYCDGQVHIASNEFPPELIDLFGGNDEDALNFKTYARLYNNMFAFSSLVGSTEAKTITGIFVFKLLGQLYHYISDLLPDNEAPKYLQLYFYDAEYELDRRSGLFPELKEEVISTLMSVMQQNPYALFFRSMREVDINDNTTITISNNPSLDQRVFNAPSSKEVAAVLLDNSHSLANNSPHIIVYGKSAESHRVMHYYGCYDPLQYPLLYPMGDSGWHQGIKRQSTPGRRPYVNSTFPISSALFQGANDLLIEEATTAARRPPKDGKEVSCREYYAYKFQIGSDNFCL